MEGNLKRGQGSSRNVAPVGEASVVDRIIFKWILQKEFLKTKGLKRKEMVKSNWCH
jgi:hypothetical protein